MNIEELNLHHNAGLARFDKWIEELRRKVKALLHTLNKENVSAREI